MAKDRSCLITGWLLIVVAISSFSGGCVQRRMTVRSNPPGALLYVDDYEVGTTPVSVNFTYYGKRKIRLVKDGYETLTVIQSIPAPWYQYFPFDFISENLIPGEIRDQRVLEYQLKPQVIVPPQQLVSRAEELRRGAHAAAASDAGGIRGPNVTGSNTNMETIPAPQGVGGRQVRPLP